MKQEKKNEEKKEKQEKTDNEEKKVVKEKLTFKQRFLLGIITIIGMLIVWMYYKVDISLTNNTIIATAAISIMVNLILVIIVFVTGIAKEMLIRLKKRITFHKGKHVNVIYVNKNGQITEEFKKIDIEDSSFKIDKERYILNARLLSNYKRLPTYIYRQGTPDPLNIWDDALANKISTREIDAVMNSRDAFDVKEWLEQNQKIVLLILIVVVIAAIIAAYMGLNATQMLRDGTYKAVTCINPPTPIIPGI